MAIQTKYQVVADVTSFDRAMANLKRTSATAAASAQKQFSALNSSVLNCTGSFGKLATGLAGGAAFAALTGVVGDALNTIKDFEKATSNLAGILGTTPAQIGDLTDQAKLLGSTTAFTASQVTQLQTELAKLGFSQTEIQQSTKAVLDLSSATGADLGDAAALAGATLRAFNMDASEMSRVTSVLAVSTTKSALDFGKLQTGMSTVAPVAKAFGFSIEDTVAMLGKLSDAGFDASSAATATRNILLNLANENGNLAKALGRPVHNAKELGGALAELRDKGVSLNEALGMTDKRSVAAFESFMTQAEGVAKLSDELTGCNDDLETMVATMTDNVQGSLDSLSSAWEGLLLSFSDSKGVFRDIIDGLTSIVQALAAVIGGVEEAQKKVDSQARQAVDAERGRRKEEMQKQIDRQVADLLKQDPLANADEIKRKVIEAESSRLEKVAQDDAAILADLEGTLNRVNAVLGSKHSGGYGDFNKALEEGGMTKEEWQSLAEMYKGYGGTNASNIRKGLASVISKQRQTAYSSQVNVDLLKEITRPKAQSGGNGPVPSEIEEFDENSIEGIRRKLKQLRKERDQLNPQTQASAFTAYSMQIKELEERLKELTGSTKSTSKALKEVGKEGSLSYYEDQLAKANEAYKMATDDAGRTAAKKLQAQWQKAIDDIERKPVEVDVVTRVQQSQSLLSSAPSETDVFGSAKSAEDMYNAYGTYIDKLRADFESLGDTIAEAMSKGASADALQPLMDQYEQTAKAVDDATAKQEGFKQSVIDNRNLQSSLEQTQAGVSAIGTAFDAMGNYGNDTFKNMMGGFSDLMQAVVKLIPVLMASSMASGTEKVARTSSTWYEIIPGIAAVVAAIGGIFGSLKYAEGGIVGGSHYNADRIPALVQSGEMILNKRQQRSLFALLDGGGASGGSSAVSTMRISGRDLVATINTQNKLTTKLK